MKKEKINPLELDKETIAKLDEQQLQQIVGGATDDNGDETSCDTGGSCTTGTTCSPSPG